MFRGPLSVLYVYDYIFPLILQQNFILCGIDRFLTFKLKHWFFFIFLVFVYTLTVDTVTNGFKWWNCRCLNTSFFNVCVKNVEHSRKVKFFTSFNSQVLTRFFLDFEVKYSILKTFIKIASLTKLENMNFPIQITFGPNHNEKVTGVSEVTSIIKKTTRINI